MAITPQPDPPSLPSPPAPTRTPRTTRPARALIGWMAPDEAHLTLNGRVAEAPVSLEHARRAQQAREAVAERQGTFSQSDLIEAAPPDLDEYIATLMASPPAAPFRDEGWKVAIVDLAKIIAIQPHVHIDHGRERVRDIEPHDVRAMAAVTLPLPAVEELPAQLDSFQRSLLVSSADPNLRILGPWASQVEPGVAALGFTVAIAPSYMQVARFRGRYLLRDGYHRAVAFLQRGFTKVPAFVRDFSAFENLEVPVGLLPPAAYLGDQPPFLTDYLDNTVAADVHMPVMQKFVVVNGLELNSAA